MRELLSYLNEARTALTAAALVVGDGDSVLYERITGLEQLTDLVIRDLERK